MADALTRQRLSSKVGSIPKMLQHTSGRYFSTVPALDYALLMSSVAYRQMTASQLNFRPSVAGKHLSLKGVMRIGTDSCTDDDRDESRVRVLVVEDFEPFRRFVCSTLGKQPNFKVICEVSDGLEAVDKAEDLQPDLIVLDIGLPSLSGIEVARRIHTLSPNSKILFLTQESSADVVDEAFGLGALGYVIKMHAGIELSAAVEEVRQGRRFVGSGLLSHHSAVAG